jgi:short subunit fatty acids transporter
MAFPAELITNIFTVIMVLILVAVVGLLFAMLIETNRQSKQLDQEIAARKAKAMEKGHKTASLLLKHS